MLPRILQFLPTIYRGFQQDSQITICENEKGMHRELGMGRQRTASVRRIKDKTQHGTSTGLLRPPRTNQNRNRCLEICLLRDTVRAMPVRKMEPSGVPIQDNVGRRMQLRHTRQGTTGDSAGIPRMKKIQKRESENRYGSSRTTRT